MRVGRWPPYALDLRHELHVGEHVELGGDAEDFGFLESIAEGVSVRVDQSGEESISSGIDRLHAGRNFQILADGFDFAGFHQHVGVFKNFVAVEYAGATDDKAVDRVGTGEDQSGCR